MEKVFLQSLFVHCLTSIVAIGTLSVSAFEFEVSALKVILLLSNKRLKVHLSGFNGFFWTINT